MRSDYQKGRADAAMDKYDPPEHKIFENKQDREDTNIRIQEYNEGYHDKRREMGH